MGRIIAHSGAHGTGKTTAVYRHAHELKMQYPELRVDIVKEVARQCPFPINKQTTVESQQWIFARQTEAELTALSAYDIVVSDRPIFDCIGYTLAAGLDNLAGSMMRLAEYHVDHYERILFHTIDRCNFLCRDGVREVDDLEFQKRVEEEIIRVYDRLNLTFEEFEPDIRAPQPPIEDFKPNVQIGRAKSRVLPGD